MNLSNFWDAESIKANQTKLKKIFFFRICGMGMGTTATLFREAGFDVAGCDVAFYPPMGDYLKKSGVECLSVEETTAETLKKYDLVVVGNSISANTKEAQLIEECGVPFTSFPCILGEMILKHKKVVGIAGTHGKTTTSYYLTQMLTLLGEDTGYLVGGVLTDREASHLGKSDYFVIESDEYDSSYFQKFSKFRLYHISELVLTALEYDHADIFPTMRDIEVQFEHIIPNIKGMVYNADYPSAQKMADYFKKLQHKIALPYGLQHEAGPAKIETHNGITRFSLQINGKEEEFETNIIGPQNILNLTSCILFCLKENFGITAIKETLKKLKNVKRRQELRGKYNNLLVIDDFAHHPTAITLTLEGIKKTYPNKPIHVIFEAVTSTARSNAFQKEFAKSLSTVTSVLVANPKIPTNAKQFENLNYALLTKDITSFGVFSQEYTELKPLRQTIDKLSEKDGVLLVLSNRTVLGLWESDFVKLIK